MQTAKSSASSLAARRLERHDSRQRGPKSSDSSQGARGSTPALIKTLSVKPSQIAASPLAEVAPPAPTPFHPVAPVSMSGTSISPGGPLDDGMVTMEILEAIRPSLSAATLQAIRAPVTANNVSVTLLARLGEEWLRDACNVNDQLERARLTSALHSRVIAPAPRNPDGGPVAVRPKVGFTNVNNIDTAASTIYVSFFLDLYWNDPRLVGASSVPDGTWRPEGVYAINTNGGLTVEHVPERPTLVDLDENGKSKAGLLLWPSHYSGDLRNPMNLRQFPFDHDYFEISLMNGEHTSAEEYVFRAFPEDEQERASVRFFFDVGADVPEWDMRGFSKLCYEAVGGIPNWPFTHCNITLHMTRRWQFYAWKVILPLLICTVFDFCVFALPPDDLLDRSSISITLFLATSALLYVIASTVPKTSYLTVIDKLVVMVLAVQFLIGIANVATSYLATPEHMALASRVDMLTCQVLASLLAIGFVMFFVGPVIASLRTERTAWPDILARSPETEYHIFTEGVNIFPPPHPGKRPPFAVDLPAAEPAVRSDVLALARKPSGFATGKGYRSEYVAKQPAGNGGFHRLEEDQAGERAV